MSAQTAADLRAAIEVLKRDGWSQHCYVAEQGSCCAVGALMKVVDPTVGPRTDVEDIEGVAYERLAAAGHALTKALRLPDRYVFWDAPITRWNDDQETVEQVIAGIETAAAAEESE